MFLVIFDDGYSYYLTEHIRIFDDKETAMTYRNRLNEERELGEDDDRYQVVEVERG